MRMAVELLSGPAKYLRQRLTLRVVDAMLADSWEP
jgi:hypothetical protein